MLTNIIQFIKRDYNTTQLLKMSLTRTGARTHTHAYGLRAHHLHLRVTEHVNKTINDNPAVSCNCVSTLFA